MDIKCPPTQQRILNILADGMAHRREEVWTALQDELASPQNIYWHITALRKVLQPQGQTIVCELNGGRIHYRWVRLLASANDGRR